MPHVNQLIGKFGSKGLIVIGITREDPVNTRSFMSKTGAKWIVAYDPQAIQNYGITGYPTAVLIDSEGNIAWRGHPQSLKDSQIESLLKKMDPSQEKNTAPEKPVKKKPDPPKKPEKTSAAPPKKKTVLTPEETAQLAEIRKRVEESRKKQEEQINLLKEGSEMRRVVLPRDYSCCQSPLLGKLLRKEAH